MNIVYTKIYPHQIVFKDLCGLATRSTLEMQVCFLWLSFQIEKHFFPPNCCFLLWQPYRTILNH